MRVDLYNDATTFPQLYILCVQVVRIVPRGEVCYDWR